MAGQPGRPRRSELDLLRAAAEVWDQDDQTIGFLARLFAQTSLPYRDPGDVAMWGRRNGNLSLVVQPGMVVERDGTGRSLGYPFGTIPRLLLTWMSTEAVRTKSPELALGASLADFMRALDLQPSGGRNGSVGRLRTQMERLFQATLSVRWDGDGSRESGGRLNIASAYDLWWAGRNPEHPTLMPSTVRLSADFFNEVVTRPVPVDVKALRALRGSPLRLDLYCFLTYRASYLRRRTEIPWESLRAQFGSNNANTPQGRAQFRKDLERNLREVLLVYREMRCEITKVGLLLLPSPTSVPMCNLRALTGG